MRTIKLRLWNGKRFDKHSFYPAMEYTGMRDANNKEIFEGDLVVIIDNFGGIISWDEEACLFYMEDGIDNPRLAEYKSGDLKIVGNVLENPEMLENEQ